MLVENTEDYVVGSLQGVNGVPINYAMTVSGPGETHSAVFFDPTDSEALHRYLAELCANEPGRARLQRAAYEQSLTYSLTRTTSAYLSLYDGLLASTRTSTPVSPIEVRA